MRISKRLIILGMLSLLLCPAKAQIGMQELGDSLTAYTGFSPVWAPAVQVKNLRVNGNNVTVRTNITLRDVRWTPESVAQLKRKVSRWVLGHEKGKVTIQAGRTNIEELVTECAKNPGNGLYKQADLRDRQIVLYPSHGLYFNQKRNEWIWQRATLWTTVEDLYSQEYVRLISRMLENAGATVLSPRAGLEQQQSGVSGMPQWTEGALYWLSSQGADSTLWNLYEGDEYKDDMKCRAMWVNSLPGKIDLCLALHTDGLDSGNDSTIVGTLAIYTAKDDEGNTRLRDGRDREKTNRNLADRIQTQVTQDLRAVAPEWTRRQLKEANYCESRVPVVPSIILELLSHKNMADMRYGLDPAFRFKAARAVYKGILRYLNGKSAVIQPLPVKDLGIRFTPGSGTTVQGELRWRPVTDTLEQSAKPTYYMVYIQANDGEWDIQQVENDTMLTVELQRGVKYDYYVVAGNEGGLSFPSPVISAYRAAMPDEAGNETFALVVDAFDEVYGVEWFADSAYAGIVPGSYACEDGFSCAYIGQQWDYRRNSVWTNDDNCGWGACYRDHAGQLTAGNTHDWSSQHGRELRKMKISYASCTAGMTESYRPLSTDIQLMDVICGRNRTPLSAPLQATLSGYLDQGGRVLLSTDHFSAIDPLWAKKYLHASAYAAQATRSGRVHGIRHRLYQILLEPNEEQLFTCHPEGLMPTDTTAVRLATYEDMRCPAAVGYNRKTAVFGFPLETVTEYDRIYRHYVKWLLDK